MFAGSPLPPLLCLAGRFRAFLGADAKRAWTIAASAAVAWIPSVMLDSAASTSRSACW
jgi:hypothetical protein